MKEVSHNTLNPKPSAYCRRLISFDHTVVPNGLARCALRLAIGVVPVVKAWPAIPANASMASRPSEGKDVKGEAQQAGNGSACFYGFECLTTIYNNTMTQNKGKSV